MARNLQPRHRASRRFGENVADTVKSPLLKKKYPPGIHGSKRAYAKISEYGRQLMEKQKAKAIYGLLERQFRLTFSRAQKMAGDVGQNLIALLETRLDNVVFRSGWAPTHRLARQLVTHGHFTINGQKVDIPSYQLKAGQVIKVKENKLKKTYWDNFQKTKADKKRETPGWLAVDDKAMSLTMTSWPNKDDLPKNIEVHLIVDFYSR